MLLLASRAPQVFGALAFRAAPVLAPKFESHRGVWQSKCGYPHHTGSEE
jgi:hypothetical protein